MNKETVLYEADKIKNVVSFDKNLVEILENKELVFGRFTKEKETGELFLTITSSEKNTSNEKEYEECNVKIKNAFDWDSIYDRNLVDSKAFKSAIYSLIFGNFFDNKSLDFSNMDQVEIDAHVNKVLKELPNWIIATDIFVSVEKDAEKWRLQPYRFLNPLGAKEEYEDAKREIKNIGKMGKAIRSAHVWALEPVASVENEARKAEAQLGE